MDRSQVMTLIQTNHKPDAIGQIVPAAPETRREVFCKLSSVSASEMFDAGRAGFKPEYRASMFVYDYDGEDTVELDGTRYGVYRTFLGRNETIELYLERKAGV